MHYIDLQHSQEQRTSIYNLDSSESSGWKAVFISTHFWSPLGLRKREGAGIGRCVLKTSYSLEPRLCHLSYELWPPQGRSLQHRHLEIQTDTPRVYHGAAVFC